MPTFRTASARQRMPLRAPPAGHQTGDSAGRWLRLEFVTGENKSCPGAGRDIMARVEHLSTAELVAGLSDVRDSPSDGGTVELIVRRPAVDEREVLAEAALDVDAGLAGDTWPVRGSKRTADGSPHPGMQLTVMNSRAALLVARDPGRRMLAGDQLYADLDLSPANLPPGTRLALGSAVIEVTDQPHLGCPKFAARFGGDAWRFVNSRVGRELRLRGMNARVVVSGTVRPGDAIRKCPADRTVTTGSRPVAPT